MEDSIVQVISSEYCSNDSLKLKIDMKKGVTYIDDKVVFKVKKPSFTLHYQPVLYDVSGNPIATLYKKKLSAHSECQVFKGKKKDPNELLFEVKRSRVLQTGLIDLDVFLANNKEKTRVCDFKVNVSRNKKSGEIYAGQSSRIIAKMKNDKMFEVLVEPNVDHAFIVALLMIVNHLKYLDDDFVCFAAEAGCQSLVVTLFLAILCFN